MATLNLPRELILSVAELLSYPDISALARTSRDLYVLLKSCIYRKDVRKGHFAALYWGARNLNAKVIQLSLDAGANLRAMNVEPPKDGPWKPYAADLFYALLRQTDAEEAYDLRARVDYISVMHLLADNGADINANSRKEGPPAVHEALG